MKAFKLTLYVLAGIIILVLLVALFLPANKTVSSSYNMNAPAKTVFDQVNNFKNWENWSPWADDTTMVNTYEGPDSGVGAKSSWISEQSGNGSQTIIESQPFKFIRNELDMGGGSKAESSWEFIESDSGTMVTWSLILKDLGYPFGRYFGLFAGKMMDPFFEKGLMQLSQLVEKLPKWKTTGIEQTTLDSIPCLQIYDSCLITEFSTKMGQCYGVISQSIAKQQATFAGAPFAIYLSWNPEGYIPMILGIPVNKPLKSSGRVRAAYTPSGKVLKAIHQGSYDLSGETHAVIDAYINDNQLIMNGAPWEVYITDPMTEPDTVKWLTEIYYPLK